MPNAIYLEHKVTSLSGYLSLTKKIHESWDHRQESPDPWFRGLSNAEHVLKPGWYRLSRHNVKEGDLWDEFERRAIPLVEGHKPTSALEWYFLMQHYGMPTRLLDWSECSLVGLYFAIGDWKGHGDTNVTDAVVWMLDPWYLNKWSLQKDEVFRYDDRIISRYLPDAPWKDKKIPKQPVALVPIYNSRRITAQRGVFTIHGTNKESLDKILPKVTKPHFCRIVIPKKYVLEIRESLRLAGITDINMFPEMSYLCQDIMSAWGLLGK